MRLFVIVSPTESEPDASASSTPRQSDDVDEFAEVVGRPAGAKVPIIEGTLADAPHEGFLIDFDGYGLARQPELGPRVILMNVFRDDPFVVLEKHNLVAAIERYRYFQWRKQRSQESGNGVFGRKDVAERMGAGGVGYKDTEHYRLLSCDRYADLPGLLVGYLRAYEEMQLLTKV